MKPPLICSVAKKPSISAEGAVNRSRPIYKVKATASGLKEKVIHDTTGFKVHTYLFSKVVMKFEDFENRRDWMIRFVNEQLREAVDIPTLSRRDVLGHLVIRSLNCFALSWWTATDTQNELMEKVYEIVWNSHDTKGVKVATQFMRALGADQNHKTS